MEQPRPAALVRTGEANARRIKEATHFADEVFEILLQVEESSITGIKRGELAALAVGSLYQAEKLPLPRELAVRLAKTRKLNEVELRLLLRDAHAQLANRRSLPASRTRNRVVEQVLGQIDPHAVWAPRPRSTFSLGGGTPVGVGLRLRTDPETRMVHVITPLYRSPAYRAGIRAGDILTQITLPREGRLLDPPRVVRVAGLPGEEVEEALRGPSGTMLQLTIRRQGVKKPLVFRLTRRHVWPETVLGWQRQADDRWSYWLDRRAKIGYVRLRGVERKTEGEFRQIMAQLKREGVMGLILDLRANATGLFEPTLNIAGMFVGNRLLTRIRTGDGTTLSFKGKRPGEFLRLPVVCLVNRDSTQVIEVLAACLQDHGRALLVGERSRGRGSVQNITVANGEDIILTTAVFFRPNGKKLDRIHVPGCPADDWGVTPDPGYLVSLTPRERAQLETFLDRQLILPLRDGSGMGADVPEMDRQLRVAVVYLRNRIKKSS